MGQFIGGLGLTLQVSALALLISLPLGLVGAMLRTSGSRPLSLATGAYVEVFRNVPLLVIIYAVFYGLPSLGVRFDSLITGVVALSLNSTAYLIEIFRGAMAAIPGGQHDAAYSLGMRRRQAFAFVVMPQLVRIAFPALGNQVVGLVLGSSLVSVVGVAELTSVSYRVGSITYRFFEVFVVAALLYVIGVQTINRLWVLVGTRWLRHPVSLRGVASVRR